MSLNQAKATSPPAAKKNAPKSKSQKNLDPNKAPPPRKRTKTGCRTCRKRFVYLFDTILLHSGTGKYFISAVFWFYANFYYSLGESSVMRANHTATTVSKLIVNVRVTNSVWISVTA